jgi:hypothetical protein
MIESLSFKNLKSFVPMPSKYNYHKIVINLKSQTEKNTSKKSNFKQEQIKSDTEIFARFEIDEEQKLKVPLKKNKSQSKLKSLHLIQEQND